MKANVFLDNFQILSAEMHISENAWPTSQNFAEQHLRESLEGDGAIEGTIITAPVEFRSTDCLYIIRVQALKLREGK